jgi:glycine/D-amino acid oxidase-like deaminating enzyme
MALCLDTDIGLREKGIAYLALTQSEMANQERWLDETRAFQQTSRLLSPAQAGDMIGQDAHRFHGGILTPSDMHAEPGLAVPALAHLAAKTGAQVFEQTAVRCLDLAGGQLAGIITEHRRIACQSVIFAGGAWARTFVENMGLSLPQIALRSQSMRSAPVATASAGPV